MIWKLSTCRNFNLRGKRRTSRSAKLELSVGIIVKELVNGLPIFAEEWLPGVEVVREVDSDLMMKALVYGTV